MKPTVFFSLMSQLTEADLRYFDLLDSVYFDADNGKSSISFYATDLGGFKLIVSKFYPGEPTKEQKDAMQARIDSFVAELRKHQEETKLKESDPYHYFGVNQKDFL